MRGGREFDRAIKNLKTEKRVVYVTKVPQVCPCRETKPPVPFGRMCQSRYSHGRRRRGAFHLRAGKTRARASDNVGPARIQVSIAVGYLALLSNCWNCCEREVLLSREICLASSPETADRSVTFGWSCPWKRGESFLALWLLLKFYGCASHASEEKQTSWLTLYKSQGKTVPSSLSP